MKPRHVFPELVMALGVALMALTSQPAVAATLCVNPGGSNGCYKTIGAAVAAAAANDTINVAAGTYKEDVVIGKALSLIGASRTNTTIDATGLANGIYIDGMDNAGLANVVVRGFSVNNANFEGILITNASSVTISDSKVLNNNISLDIVNVVCPGQPDFETAEGFDCGEGIHLSGVDHSTVANNIVENNSGGILLSDDTGLTNYNVITGNLVKDNPFDCGIVMASHPPAAITGATTPFGIKHNTIANNTSDHNGTQVPGAGAGVGIFTFLPGGTVSGNFISNNRLTNNGLPGVAFHAHGTGEDLSNNIIVGNQISGNGADTDDAATPGTTGINVFGVSAITGTVISQNTITREGQDIVLNTPAQVDINLNDLVGGGTGVDNIGTGTGDATENWWGCAGGPGASGCTSISGSGVLSGTFLTKQFRPKGIISIRVFAVY
jgi:parallel beta-helix repeat protein